MNIYHLECSVNDNEHSLTRKYSRMIVNLLKQKHEDSQVTYVDLMKENIPFIDKIYEAAMFKSEKDRTEEEKQALTSFDLKTFINADIYVLGIPGYFFNVPARFKNWLEHLFRIDVTLTKNWNGLLENKKIFIVSAWGGVYTNTVIEHSFETFLEKSFELFGINNIHFFNMYRDKETNSDNIALIEEAIKGRFS